MMFLKRVIFWLLLPVAGLQGLSLRKQALRPRPPPGPTHGQIRGLAGQNRFSTPLRLLALGDSIIAGIGASSQDQTLPAQLARSYSQLSQRAVNWKALGTSGADSADLLALLETLEDEPMPDLVLVSIGVNDVTGLRSCQSWRANLEKVCSLLGARWPEAIIIFAGLPPMEQFPLPPQPLRWCLGVRAALFDQLAASLVDIQAGMIHIPTLIDPGEHDFCPDGFHPSESAYAFWGEEMARIITDEFSSSKRRVAQ
jgi:lysophospholipase L1-like esterase